MCLLRTSEQNWRVRLVLLSFTGETSGLINSPQGWLMRPAHVSIPTVSLLKRTKLNQSLDCEIDDSNIQTVTCSPWMKPCWVRLSSGDSKDSTTANSPQQKQEAQWDHVWEPRARCHMLGHQGLCCWWWCYHLSRTTWTHPPTAWAGPSQHKRWGLITAAKTGLDLPLLLIKLRDSPAEQVLHKDIHGGADV